MSHSKLLWCVCVQIGSHIKKQVGELGFSCTGLVTKAGALQCSPNDSFTKKELIESARKVSEKVRAQPVSFCMCLLWSLGHASRLLLNHHEEPGTLISIEVNAPVRSY